MTLQGDHSACAKPPVDFRFGLARPSQAKAELLFEVNWRFCTNWMVTLNICGNNNRDTTQAPSILRFYSASNTLRVAAKTRIMRDNKTQPDHADLQGSVDQLFVIIYNSVNQWKFEKDCLSCLQARHGNLVGGDTEDLHPAWIHCVL